MKSRFRLFLSVAALALLGGFPARAQDVDTVLAAVRAASDRQRQLRIQPGAIGFEPRPSSNVGKHFGHYAGLPANQLRSEKGREAYIVKAGRAKNWDEAQKICALLYPVGDWVLPEKKDLSNNSEMMGITEDSGYHRYSVAAGSEDLRLYFTQTFWIRPNAKDSRGSAQFQGTDKYLVRALAGADFESRAEAIERWKHFQPVPAPADYRETAQKALEFLNAGIPVFCVTGL